MDFDNQSKLTKLRVQMEVADHVFNELQQKMMSLKGMNRYTYDEIIHIEEFKKFVTKAYLKLFKSIGSEVQQVQEINEE